MEEFISKMLYVCVGEQIVTWSSALNISITQRVQPPNVTECQLKGLTLFGKSGFLSVFVK